jgi:hypothetical protein
MERSIDDDFSFNMEHGTYIEPLSARKPCLGQQISINRNPGITAQQKQQTLVNHQHHSLGICIRFTRSKVEPN